MIWPPNSCSPNLKDCADSIRRLLNNNEHRQAVLVPVIKKVNYRDIPTEPIPVKKICLLVKRYWGGAPYVGKPFVYTWLVGSDGLGNFVSTSVEIQYLVPYRYT